jgi:hypothetical protein
MKCNPARWVGLGFVATIENAPAQHMAEIEGISSVAAQIAWGLDPVKPEVMEDYLDDLRDWDLRPVGWAWCDAGSVDEAKAEGLAHARIAANLGLEDFIANQEESYDAHGDSSSHKYRMSTAYCESFRSILPDIEFAVTTLNKHGSEQDGMRAAGATFMPQCFFGEHPSATLDAGMQHAVAWGWPVDRVRPLVQVYETHGVVPDPNVYLQESADWDVGVVPYILEQAYSGQGRAALSALIPAITRSPASIPPTNGGTVPPGNEIPPIKPNELIGSEHGITALVDWLQRQPGMPVRGANYNPAKPGTWPWPERLERTLKILAADHDAGL